jgi:hypothetical protein
LKIPFQKYTFESFIETIISMKLPPPTRLKIACFLTHFTQWDGDRIPSLKAIFNSRAIRIEPMGDINMLSGWYFDREWKEKRLANFYTYLNPETRLLLCFTDAKKYAIDETIGNVADTSTGIYYMFVSPKIFEEVRLKIIEKFPSATCFYFTAKHFPQFARKGETRPHIERTIIYHGDDSLQTLEEVQQYYGVSPRIMRYEIPDMGNYEINNTGYFTVLKTEDPEPSRKFLLSLVDLASVYVLRSRQIIERADFVLIPLRTEQKTFEIPKLLPWVVRFGKQLDFPDAQSLLESMVNNGYTVFNYAMTKGSFRLNGMVIDENKNNLFTIDVDSEKMIIAPRGRISFDAFLRFFATVVENFDPQAAIEEFV